ncbi:MAG: accessory factor UbiK family protein [Bauldia sp.]
MTQTSNRMFDELARLMTDAASVAQGVKREAETAFRSQVERFINDLNLVKREDFDVVRELASKARAENEALSARIAALEAKLAGETVPGGGEPGSLTDEAASKVKRTPRKPKAEEV